MSVWGGTLVGFVYRWEPKLCCLTSFHFFIYFRQGPAWLEMCSTVLGELSAEANNCSPSVLSTTGTSPGDLGSPWGAVGMGKEKREKRTNSQTKQDRYKELPLWFKCPRYSFHAWSLPLGKLLLMLCALQTDTVQLWL